MAEVDTEIPIFKFEKFLPLYPLPLRLATLLIYGIWLYGINLRVFNRLNLDTAALLHHPSTPNHTSVFRLAAVLSIVLATSTALYWAATHFGNTERALQYFALPNGTLLLIILLAFILPNRTLFPKQLWPSGRSRARNTLGRVCWGGLAPDGNGRFGDILMADALTSYSRPLMETYLSFRLFFTSADTVKAAAGGVNRNIDPWLCTLIFCWPFLMRMRQCHVANQPGNLLKYAASVTALIMATIASIDKGDLWAQVGLPISALVATFYSFYWDVAYDWDLELFSYSAWGDSNYPHGLRPTLLFAPWKYYAMILLDLLLRLVWMMRFLAPHFYGTEPGFFFVEILEITRRFLWTFFRVETEHLRKVRVGMQEVEMRERGVYDYEHDQEDGIVR
ncbi:hypothetical protein LTR62_003725 [Meristemomyces frigidus]|uniref:EXS domain-containing protein n=1 Tax=Meristemomyces frigidus TaxID=1508187 RepID=A0AAN7YGK2_9PEZI|nr:hypothetical protein LTR62_003725 [Meristemomyces frigidus]